MSVTDMAIDAAAGKTTKARTRMSDTKPVVTGTVNATVLHATIPSDLWGFEAVGSMFRAWAGKWRTITNESGSFEQLNIIFSFRDEALDLTASKPYVPVYVNQQGKLFAAPEKRKIEGKDVSIRAARGFYVSKADAPERNEAAKQMFKFVEVLIEKGILTR